MAISCQILRGFSLLLCPDLRDNHDLIGRTGRGPVPEQRGSLLQPFLFQLKSTRVPSSVNPNIAASFNIKDSSPQVHESINHSLDIVYVAARPSTPGQSSKEAVPYMEANTSLALDCGDST